MTTLDLWKGERPSRLISSWEPFSSEFERMVQDLERMMTPLRGVSGNGSTFVPNCDIDETEDEYHLSMDVPGIAREDIDIEVVGNTVKVSGERKKEFEEKGRNEYRLERSYGKFSRSFALPTDVKDDKITANYDNGVLSLTLPKSAKSKTKRIPVKAGKPHFLERLTHKATEKASGE